jgi:hypothetical protein
VWSERSKTFFRGSNGEAFIEEAVSLEFRDVSDEEVTLPGLPVNFDYVERKIESLRACGIDRGSSAIGRTCPGNDGRGEEESVGS